MAACPQVAGEDAPHRAGAQQRRGRVEQSDDAGELPGEHRIVFGGGLQSAEIGISDAGWQGAGPGHNGQVGAELQERQRQATYGYLEVRSSQMSHYRTGALRCP
jgi:hypothetical protein